MMKFNNCEVKAGEVSLTQRGGIAEYKVYGYAVCTTVNGVECVELQPADRRCAPVLRCEKTMIAKLTINL